MTFKTQAEIYQALLDGKKVTSVYEVDDYLHLVDGTLTSSRGVRSHEAFKHPCKWKLYRDPLHFTKKLWVADGGVDDYDPAGYVLDLLFGKSMQVCASESKRSEEQKCYEITVRELPESNVTREVK